MGLLGGLAFFLYGMEKVSDGMKKSAGGKMRAILAALTQNRVIAFIVGEVIWDVVDKHTNWNINDKCKERTATGWKAGKKK